VRVVPRREPRLLVVRDGMVPGAVVCTATLVDGPAGRPGPLAAGVAAAVATAVATGGWLGRLPASSTAVIH
jgi:hypothetical protein